MSVKFARGIRAIGLCDRCGQRYPIGDLTWQVVNTRPTGIKVCTECNDVDHPQLQLGKFPINDPVALQDPRPDINPGRSLFGWLPVGNPATYMVGNVGTVYIEIE